ncbi:glycoside hydrolase family 65 protein [bacterium]|nr:glycoside hydrolase family 65 protein [bacterium]
MSSTMIPSVSSTEWLVEEKGWNPAKQTLNESVFTLGNGYLGSRGILEEVPKGCAPGTYFAGLYDGKNTQVTELVNAPNPIVFQVKINQEELSVASMQVLSHYRALDLRQGLLVRKTVYQAKDKKRYCLESVRFFNIAEKHLAALRVCLTPLDGPANFEIETLVDDQVTNKGIMTEGNKMHYVTKEKSSSGQCNYLSDMTFEHKYLLAFATNLKIKLGKRERIETKEKFAIKANKKQTLCFTKLIAINSTRDTGITERNIKNATLTLLKQAVRKGFRENFEMHRNAWLSTWEKSDVLLGCGGEVQRALRFNIYHLAILSNPADGQASIGARALSAEDYKGHIFWDTELFMLPFYIYTDPAAARALLRYRYHRLDPARKIAAGRGYAGAQFPWESADLGVEVTPRFTVDLNGRIVKTIIGEEEHIIADIGYATWHYYHVTGDKAFMLNYGLELLLETAHYWVSRVSWNKQKKHYEIKGVMGCDEFHANTNNNAFTNGMARYNIQAALKCLHDLEKKNAKGVRQVMKKISLDKKSLRQWERVAKFIKYPPQRIDGVIEEFDGFFKMKYVKLPQRKKYYLPGVPEKYDSVTTLCNTQFVKQGDTLILLYLLSDEFDAKTKKANYEYYDARTLHKSSLSPSTYAIIGAEVGDSKKAYNYFLACLFTDIHNLYNNTARGIHGASLGATWQVAVNGFAGMRVYFDKLSFNPQVPGAIKDICFTIQWQGKPLSVSAGQKRMSLLYDAPASHTLRVYVGGKPVLLKGREQIVFIKSRRNLWEVGQ